MEKLEVPVPGTPAWRPHSHNLIGQQEEVEFKLMQTRATAKYLKAKLALEKERLERERLKTSSMFMVAARNSSFLASDSGCLDALQIPTSYSLPDWGAYNHNGNPGEAPGFFDQPQEMPANANLGKIAQFYVYKQQLDRLDKIFEQELQKMQESVSSLRRVRRSWNEVDEPAKRSSHHHHRRHHQHHRHHLKQHKSSHQHHRRHHRKHQQEDEEVKMTKEASSLGYYVPNRTKITEIRTPTAKEDNSYEDYSQESERSTDRQRRLYVEHCRKKLDFLKERNFFSNISR